MDFVLSLLLEANGSESQGPGSRSPGDVTTGGPGNRDIDPVRYQQLMAEIKADAEGFINRVIEHVDYNLTHRSQVMTARMRQDLRKLRLKLVDLLEGRGWQFPATNITDAAMYYFNNTALGKIGLGVIGNNRNEDVMQVLANMISEDINPDPLPYGWRQIIRIVESYGYAVGPVS